jgi:uncharacterized protein (TIGR02147 family)
MKPITDYLDYREYMRDFYEEQKAASAFSWRAFSKLAGFASSAYLKLVCDGKTRLSSVGAVRVAKAMGLSRIQTEYFSVLVRYCETEDAADKEKALLKLQEIAKDSEIRVVGGDAHKYFESWWNPVLRELVTLMPGASPLQMSNMLYGGVTRIDVQEALNFLVDNGFLERTANNTYKQTDMAIMGSSEATPKAIRSMHRQMTLLAAKLIDELPKSERNFSGLTIAANERTYERVVSELNACRKKIASIVTNAEDATRIYRVNLQMFPVTRDISKEG